MRLYEIESFKPKVGDKIEFPDDTISDKGPASGTVKSVRGEEVTFTMSDATLRTNWYNLAKNCDVVHDGKLWTLKAADKKAAKLVDLIK